MKQRKSKRRGVELKKRIVFILNYLWTIVVAFLLPLCIAIIFMDITGHSKGYSYDLGPEKDVSIIIGFIELGLWIALSLPSIIYVINSLKGKNRYYYLITALIYILMAFVFIILIGGWNEYIKAFGF